MQLELTGVGLGRLRLLPWTATLFLVAPLAGAMVDRIGERPLIVGGLALQAAGLVWIALIAQLGASLLGDGGAAGDRWCRNLDGDPGGPERGRERGRSR